VRQLPAPGTRVSLRYRLPAGSVPPLTDVVGHLLAAQPTVRVQTKTGAVVDISPSDVVAVRELTATPVRTSQIRSTEHAAALAWPGREQEWLDGWLLRAADGHTRRANSAVPLDISATAGSAAAIVDWYERRGLTPWLAVPDRLLLLPDGVHVELESLVMVREVSNVTPVSPTDAKVTLASLPDSEWMRLYEREVPVDVLAAVVDGEVTFGARAGAAVGRAAVTDAPDGIRWVGVSAVRVADAQRRRGHARALCSSLLAWGAGRGASRAYVQVLADNAAAITLYESMGFVTQHRERYLDARRL
jgi:ribosomal protein S18 acetylase RimI-like enzyme